MKITREKWCVIDIGTNSIRMLIAKIKNGEIIYNKKNIEMTRIGEGVDRTKMLSQAAIARSIAALKKLKDEAVKEGVKSINAIATSAVRDALNKDEFIRIAKDKLDLDIRVISGEEEAELGFMGVINGIKKDVKDLLVIDIGGGSTEFIFGNNKGIKYLRSLNVGAVRMTDKHITNDPITDYEIHNLKTDIKNIISEITNKINEFRIVEAAGIGGTVTTLAAISQGLEIYDRDKVHNYELKIEEIRDMIYMFKNLKNSERKKIKGLQPKRADIILAGSIILFEILTALNLKRIRISEFDNLEGFIYKDIRERK
ncbi:Ppx/GppA phosphatase family protein [Paramaledivibacter caminithermalis]|uniref:Exopolyphosphatase / guanosine-5'-triphosphate,3'-diphosphate pyrophosphatase n=1 Tax=Paramaledivibacter caminithermalis (strain DSM 15212 / CIP 107654 / DViRD3) TaxID=1121301 RepID=A0A1M6QNC6_PARC5|nr:Ppx/GppA phosphatase family protein [Paramaledivibacter caminithermalis]SHK21744.1 exopolyphosphatase / guanosine-5'-triphosphate,3'-diphosphate pyrophosphatase [Paramaledivibacter caminithermalis DSM 15212]